MNKLRKFFRSGAVTLILFVIAVSLLFAGGIGGARAVFSTTSENYVTHVEVKSIDIALVENDVVLEPVDTLLENMLEEGEELKLGYGYKEELAVKNTGKIDEYVRVILYKYWVDPSGNKVSDLSPKMIDLGLTNTNHWLLDENKGSSTNERTIIYYYKPLSPDEVSELFSDTITIDGKVMDAVSSTSTTDENGYTVITNTYQYDGYSFVLEAIADGVQTHNPVNAIKSAWGIDVEINSEGILTLKEAS